MATKGGEVEFEFKGNTKDLDENLKDSQKKVNSFASKISTSLGKGLTTVLSGTVAGISAVTAAIGASAVAGAKYNATIEQYATSFEVMTGSAEKATEVVEKLKKIGAETPFEMTDLADTTQLLMNYGLTADDAISKMQVLGDISQGSAEKMNRITMAYGQMSSAGKVQLEDIKQMIEAGFNPLQEISESTGESMESLYDRISKGTISVDEITASMERSTSAGGKYFQSMEKQSKTVSGQLSTLKDNTSSLLGSLSSGFSEALGSQILPMLNETASGLQEAFNTGGLEGFASAIGPAIASILTDFSVQLPSILNLATSIISNLILGIQQNLPQIALSAVQILSTLAQNIMLLLPQILELGIQLLTELALGIAQALPELIPQAIQCIFTLVDTLLDNLPALITAGIELIVALGMGLIDAIPEIIAKVPEIIGNLVAALCDPAMLGKLIEGALQLMIALAVGLIQALPQLLLSIPRIILGIKEAFTDYDWGALGTSLLQGLLNGFSQAGNIIWNAIKSVGNSMIDGIKSFFGIASPSKLMRDEIGKFLPQGIAVGVEVGTDSALKAVDDMNKSVMKESLNLSDYAFSSAFDVSPQLKASTSNNYSSNVVVNVNNSMEFDPLGQMVTRTKTFSNGSKNSYNYGMA